MFLHFWERGRGMVIWTHLRAPAAFKSNSNARPRLLTAAASGDRSMNNLQTWATAWAALRASATGRRTLKLSSVYLPCVSCGSCPWLYFLGCLCGTMRSLILTGLTTERRRISQVMWRMTSTSDIQVGSPFCCLFWLIVNKPVLLIQVLRLVLTCSRKSCLFKDY